MKNRRIPARHGALLANDLLAADAAIRAAARAAQLAPRGGGPVRVATDQAGYGPSITISLREARTMLRAALPAPLPPFRGRTRQQHAELIIALSLFSSHLEALASGDGERASQAQRHCLGSALDLADVLREWIEAMRWREATKAAKKRWPRHSQAEPAEVPISTVLRQLTLPETAPNGNENEAAA